MTSSTGSRVGDPTDPRALVRFGVAGWSYPDWKGIVYPPGLAAAEQLPYLSRFVDVIEINSTFYRPPTLGTVEGWRDRTAGLPDLRFTAKIPAAVTHERELDEEAADRFFEAFEPLRTAGKLLQILAQFRFDFRDSPPNRSLLTWIQEHYGRTAPLVVEVRHNSWQSPSALAALSALGVTVANLDLPLARDSFSLIECVVGLDGYLRLHGRNRKAWFDRNAGRDETYNYLYNHEELAQIHTRLRTLARRYRAITVIANNHYRGKELANALELKALHTGSRVEVPPTLLAEYPRLAAVAAPGEPGA